eukprot:scaffold157068_cov41-Attheya_sp.AAC.1
MPAKPNNKSGDEQPHQAAKPIRIIRFVLQEVATRASRGRADRCNYERYGTGRSAVPVPAIAARIYQLPRLTTRLTPSPIYQLSQTVPPQ